jgi:hypothetical protein
MVFCDEHEFVSSEPDLGFSSMDARIYCPRAGVMGVSMGYLATVPEEW